MSHPDRHDRWTAVRTSRGWLEYRRVRRFFQREYIAAAGPEVRGHDDDHCEEHGTELPGSVVCLAGINGERTILDHG